MERDPCTWYMRMQILHFGMAFAFLSDSSLLFPRVQGCFVSNSIPGGFPDAQNNIKGIVPGRTSSGEFKIETFPFFLPFLFFLSSPTRCATAGDSTRCRRRWYIVARTKFFYPPRPAAVSSRARWSGSCILVSTRHNNVIQARRLTKKDQLAGHPCGWAFMPRPNSAQQLVHGNRGLHRHISDLWTPSRIRVSS